MTVKIHEIGSVCVTVWGEGAPTLEEVDRTLTAAQAQYERIQKPLSLIGVLAWNTKMPSPEVLARMQSNWPKLMELSVSMHYINLTQLFVFTRLTSMLVGLFQLTKHGKTVNIYYDVPTLIEATIKEDPAVRADEYKLRDLLNKLVRESTKGSPPNK